MFSEKISDDYLIVLFFEKNQDAIDLLFERYTTIIYGLIKNVQQRTENYIDFNDFFQDGFLVFLSCLEKYDQDYGSFYFFVRKSIERKLLDKVICMKKHMNYLPINETIYEEGKEQIIDYISEDSAEFFNCSYSTLVDRIDAVSKEIVDYRISGYSYREIAKTLGLTKQSVYRRVGKIKNILKDIIEKID